MSTSAPLAQQPFLRVVKTGSPKKIDERLWSRTDVIEIDSPFALTCLTLWVKDSAIVEIDSHADPFTVPYTVHKGEAPKGIAYNSIPHPPMGRYQVFITTSKRVTPELRFDFSTTKPWSK